MRKKHTRCAGTNSDDYYYTDPKVGATAGFERFGWGFQILPYIEETTLYQIGKKYRGMEEIPELNQNALSEMAVSAYSCPSRGQRYGATPDGWIPALGDYAGVMFGYMLEQYRTNYNYNAPEGQLLKKYGWRGIVSKGGHYNGTTYSPWKEINVKDVTDGTSKTVAIMEKAVWVGRYRPENFDEGYSDMPGWATQRPSSKHAQRVWRWRISVRRHCVIRYARSRSGSARVAGQCRFKWFNFALESA